MLTKIRKGAALAAVAGAALTAVAACGTSSGSASKDPKDAVAGGIDQLYSGNALTVTFKLDISAADLEAYAKRDPQGGTLTPAQAQAIAGGSIVLSEKAGSGSLRNDAKDTTAAKKGSTALTVNAGDEPNLVEVRYLNENLFARADVKKIASYGGSDLSQLDTLESNPSFSFLKPGIEGQWLKLPYQDLVSLAQSASGQAQTSIAPSQLSGLESALTQIYTKDITAAKVDSGDLGTHYVLTGSSRTVATDLVATLKTQLSSLPGASKAFEDADPSQVPDKQVKLDAYVKNGKLSALKLDVSQFASGKDLAQFAGKPFYLEADFVDSANISAPANATTINLGQIIGSLTHAGSDSSGSGVSDLPTAPPST